MPIGNSRSAHRKHPDVRTQEHYERLARLAIISDRLICHSAEACRVPGEFRTSAADGLKCPEHSGRAPQTAIKIPWTCRHIEIGVIKAKIQTGIIKAKSAPGVFQNLRGRLHQKYVQSCTNAALYSATRVRVLEPRPSTVTVTSYSPACLAWKIARHIPP